MMRQNLKHTALLAALFLFGHSQGAHADSAAQNDAPALLKADQFVELDRRFSEIQSAYRQGSLSDEELRAAFREFYDTDTSLETHYEGWVKANPNSYVAHLARGIYFKKVGQERRGTKFISETTYQQIAQMKEALSIAANELYRSFSLDKKPILSYLHAIDISSALGQPLESLRLLKLSIKIDPHNFIVREKYMGSLQTRWGGSAQEMRDFYDSCQTAGLSAVQLTTLKALVVEDEGWASEYRYDNTDAAVRSYLEAATLVPNRACVPCGPINQAASALFAKKRYQEAIPLYSQLLEADPDFKGALVGRAFSALQVGQPQLAVTDFTRAAELGDAYAQDTLGRMYLLGTSIPANRDKALVWLTKAAAQGYQPSKDLLPMALDKNAVPLLQPGGPRL